MEFIWQCMILFVKAGIGFFSLIFLGCLIAMVFGIALSFLPSNNSITWTYRETHTKDNDKTLH